MHCSFLGDVKRPPPFSPHPHDQRLPHGITNGRIVCGENGSDAARFIHSWPSCTRLAEDSHSCPRFGLSCKSEHWVGGAKSARTIVEAEPIFPLALGNSPASWVHKDPGQEDRTLDSTRTVLTLDLVHPHPHLSCPEGLGYRCLRVVSGEGVPYRTALRSCQ